MSTRKLRYEVNVPILATIRFATMASSIYEAKADVCKRLAEKDVQPEMFAYWMSNGYDDPDYEVQWDSVYAWVDHSQELTEEEQQAETLLRSPGDPNLSTDSAKHIAALLNETITGSNNYLLRIANKIAERDFAWLLSFSDQVIEESKKPGWNEPKNKTMDW